MPPARLAWLNPEKLNPERLKRLARPATGARRPTWGSWLRLTRSGLVSQSLAQQVPGRAQAVVETHERSPAERLLRTRRAQHIGRYRSRFSGDVSNPRLAAGDRAGPGDEIAHRGAHPGPDVVGTV